MIRAIKLIFNGVLWGAGVTAGIELVKTGISKINEPYKRQNLKNKFAKIKKIIKE